jgi:pimeloyl-ACP methyl ester carboxylesterase
MPRIYRKVALYALLAIIVVPAVALIWLRWDAGRSRDDWFRERHGRLTEIAVAESSTQNGQTSEFITLHSDSGLAVSLRTIRAATSIEKLPVLIVLGGHRTGSDAVELFGHVGKRAVVALDYPYDGPEKIKGVVATVRTIPLVRSALLDTPPAVLLTMDWLMQQSWVDTEQLIIVGASLGVPFAAAAAARDERIRGALLVHGAADNRVWIETQVARRNDQEFLHGPVSTILYWLAYGATFDAGENVAEIAPRPVLIIGARADERTPEGQTEALFAASGEPKLLRWTDGQHIEPGRTEIVAELLRIADEELPFNSIKR